MVARELQKLFAALECPFAPGGDDLDARLQRVIAKLETDLIVALARRAVADGVGADLFRDFDLLFGDERAGDRRAEQVDAFINSVGAEHRENVVADEFLAQVLDENVLGLDAEHQSFVARRLKFLALAEIGGERHDFGVIGFLQPFQNDRRIEAARIGEDDFLHGFGCGGHAS